MKKVNIFLLLAAFSVTGLSSCTKQDDTGGSTNGAPSNGWKLGATSYNAAYVFKANDVLSATDVLPTGSNPNVNALAVIFSTFPTTSGTYKVVRYPGLTALTANQIGLTAGLNVATYTSTGNDNINAVVTVTGGKVKISIPEVWVKKINIADSVKLSANLTEN